MGREWGGGGGWREKRGRVGSGGGGKGGYDRGEVVFVETLITVGGLESPDAWGARDTDGDEEVRPVWGGFLRMTSATENTVGGEARGAEGAVEPRFRGLVREGGQSLGVGVPGRSPCDDGPGDVVGRSSEGPDSGGGGVREGG